MHYRMTNNKQKMRQEAHYIRKKQRQNKTEATFLDRVLDRQRSILNDPERKNWNKYNCWGFRHVAGIEADYAEGWRLIINDGVITGVKEETNGEV